MTQPTNLNDRVTALETRVTQLTTAVSTLQATLATITARFTTVEQMVGTAEPRFLTLEAAARGFESRVQTLEAVSHAPSNADAARLAALETTLKVVQDEVMRLGQVTRPGRTVLRDRLTALEAGMTEVLNRLPPAVK